MSDAIEQHVPPAVPVPPGGGALGGAARTARHQRTTQELTGLAKRFKEWVAAFPDRDEDGKPAGRHKTRLEALAKAFDHFHGKLCAASTDLEGDKGRALTDGQFYENCRAIDEGAAWLWRLWRYFQERFDQRLDPRLGPVLLAADEVVWSCYRPAFAGGTSPKAAPLCFIDATHQPWALQADQKVPKDLEAGDEAKSLGLFLRGLPLSLLGLPSWCVDSPWWLVYLGHEVGHQVQNDADLIREFGQWLGRQAGAGHWAAWGEEVFADLYSVWRMGPWAALALAEALWGIPASLTRFTTDYPPGAVRLELTARLAARLFGELPEALAPFRWESWKQGVADGRRGEIDAEVAVVDSVVAAAVAEDSILRRLGLTLPEQQVEREQVQRWSRQLLDSVDPNGEGKLPAARRAASGALLAWVELLRGRDPGGNLRQRLVANTPVLLRRCAEPGPRDREADLLDGLDAQAERQADRLLYAHGWTPVGAAAMPRTNHEPVDRNQN